MMEAIGNIFAPWKKDELQRKAKRLELNNSVDILGNLRAIYRHDYYLPGWYLVGSPRWENDDGEYLGKDVLEASEMLDRLL